MKNEVANHGSTSGIPTCQEAQAKRSLELTNLKQA